MNLLIANMASLPTPPFAVGHRKQSWPWWPLLPLYPYGHRATLVRELIPGQVWSFEQLHGIWYVAVPIRMTVVKVAQGLMLYAPVPPTQEVLEALHNLEERYGPVCTIVLPTASGLEHKVPVPAMARAFPQATLWLSERQWSFPLRLPSSWLGFPASRSKVLGRDGYPHGEQLDWIPLGPLDLGLGTFLEVACLDRASGSLLVTDALVAIRPTPPAIFSLDPTSLLFHARERGSDPLIDTEANRLKGWKRILLFANFFRPSCVQIPEWQMVSRDLLAKGNRHARAHFGLYPFRWSADWEQEANQLISSCEGDVKFMLAPVLERLVLVRAKQKFLDWLLAIAERKGIKQLVGAHYHAPEPLSSEGLKLYAKVIEQKEWAPSEGEWSTLASIDQTLVKWKLVPTSTAS
jgi:hypothetical protein